MRIEGQQLQEWASRLEESLSQKGAARIGETSVASYQVHTVDPAQPGFINILLGSDAGQVFYQRRNPGEVLHLDIFHSLGKVNHRKVAERIKELVMGKLCPFLEDYPLLDYLDLQTGTGGGRVSGNLTYGQKDSLQRAHINHVHLASRLPVSLLGCLVPLVGTIEEEIMEQGHQIRKIDGLFYQRGGKKQSMDLSPYSSDSDSLLKGEGQGGQGEEGSPGSKPVNDDEQFQTALDLAQRVMNPRELKEVFDQLHLKGGHTTHSFPEDHQSLLRRLQELDLVKGDRGRLYLSEKGEKLKEFLQNHFTELEFYFRKLLRKLPLPGCGRPGFSGRSRGGGKKQRGHRHKAIPLEDKGGLGELAVPETLLAASKRWAKGEGGGNGFRRADLHYLAPKPTQPLNICLLIDASASMAGERLRAAKYLAQHLLLSTRDQVAVIAFQEQEARLTVPFTRNLTKVQQGLLGIRAQGLTPLSLGLKYALDYLYQTKKARESLLFVITDGIPTVSTGSKDPGQDALAVAEEIARRGLNFGAIGLAPNKKYLQQLTSRGRGNLYIISELEGEIMAQILHQERQKLQS